MAKKKLNGSVDLLAKAMRQVFTEAVQEGVEPLRKDVADLKEDVDERLTRIETDVENGFNELRPSKLSALDTKWPWVVLHG